MSIFEFYGKPENQTVDLKKVSIEFPETETFAQKYVEGIGGTFLNVAAGYGEALIPATRIEILRQVRPEYKIAEMS